MLDKDQPYRIMEVGCINLMNNSSINGIIQNYRDITKRKALEKQKEEFIGVASHELKTPVTRRMRKFFMTLCWKKTTTFLLIFY